MKENKFLLFLAGIDIFSEVAKIITSFGDGYLMTQGWATGLVIDLLAVYILATSTVKHKWVYAMLGGVAFISITVLIATLATLGLVHYGW